MKTGSVFLWENYPFQKDGKPKDRWFVYLGETKPDPLETNPDLIAIIAPTTTALADFYEEGRERRLHPHIKFEPLPEFGFTHVCVLDLSYSPESSSKAVFQRYVNKGEIQVKGAIPASSLREIYGKICSPSSNSFYSYRLKLDIHHNLNAIGITGLPLPERRGKGR